MKRLFFESEISDISLNLRNDELFTPTNYRLHSTVRWTSYSKISPHVNQKKATQKHSSHCGQEKWKTVDLSQNIFSFNQLSSSSHYFRGQNVVSIKVVRHQKLKEKLSIDWRVGGKERRTGKTRHSEDIDWSSPNDELYLCT